MFVKFISPPYRNVLQYPASFSDVAKEGNFWLLLKGDGAIRVKTNPDDLTLTTTTYAVGNENGGDRTRVMDVFLDPKGQEWLLTKNGLVKVEEGQSTSYFVQSEKRKGSSYRKLVLRNLHRRWLFKGSRN